MGRHLVGEACARRRADRVGQDPVGVPLVARSARLDPEERQPATPHARALHLAAQGARRRRRAQPASAARRHLGDGPSARARRPADLGRGAVGRHDQRRPKNAATGAPRHPDHDPRVALPDAHVGSPRNPRRRRDGDRRRDPRGRRVETGGAPRGDARAIGCPAREACATHRALGDGPADRGGRPVPRRSGPRDDRATAGREDLRPAGRRAGRRHDQARGAVDRTRHARPGRTRRDRAAERRVDLAARRQGDRRAGARPPVDDRVRELPAARRAADGGDERHLRGDDDWRRSREVPRRDDRGVGNDGPSRS